MDAAEILDRLVVQEQLPVEALRAATADQASVLPIFLHAIEQFLLRGGDTAAHDALFFIFHFLGEWREKSAYRPLAQLLRRPRNEIDAIFGGAITETTHRVIAAVFDGDPQPIYDVILDPEADEFIRSRMCEVIAMVTHRGEMPRAEAVRFLRACYSEIDPQDECFVWHGWQSAIAMLGLAELKPLVAQAFEREFISPGWLGFEHFEEDLQCAIDDPSWLTHRSSGEYSLFGDTIDELSTWHCFSPKEAKTEWREPAWRHDSHFAGPAINPFKAVGRNDPCPCGSGRKFKKCCLEVDANATAAQAM
jgi:hypothetical protein